MVVSRRTEAMARSRVDKRGPVCGDRPTDLLRGVVPLRSVSEAASVLDVRSKDLARRRVSSMRRLYSRARSNTLERVLCVDLYECVDLESLLPKLPRSSFFSSKRYPAGFMFNGTRTTYSAENNNSLLMVQ